MAVQSLLNLMITAFLLSSGEKTIDFGKCTVYDCYSENLMNNNKPYNALRWTARIYGTLVVALLLYLTSIEYNEELDGGASPLASLFTLFHEIMTYPHIFLPWVIAGVGLILALWKEGLGGGISLLSSIISLFTLGFPRQSNALIPISIGSVPSVLYLIYWWKLFHYNRMRSNR